MSMFLHWSLREKFVTFFLLLISFPTILFGILIYHQATATYKNQAEENIYSRLEKNHETLVSNLKEIENMSLYMIYDISFRSFFLASAEDVQEIRQAENNIRGYFTFQLMSNAYINSVELVSHEGNELRIGTPVIGSEEALDQAAIEKKGEPSWSQTYEVDSAWSGPRKVITLTRVINHINKISQPIGLVKIRLDEQELFQKVDLYSTQQGSYLVLSYDGKVILHQNKDYVGKVFADDELMNLILTSENKTMRYHRDGDNYLVVKKDIHNTNWLSVVIVSEEDVVRDLFNVRNLIMFLILLLASLGVIAFIAFYYKLIQPIVYLTEQTKQLEKGNFQAKVDIQTQDEIGKLGLRFNKMVLTIQELVDKEFRLKIKQKESELQALQNQIDPHFLYNTLDMIRWTARIEKAFETSQLIERLSKVFRMNLNRGGMWVSIEEEMTFLQNYLELQRSRMGTRLHFSIFYDDQVKNTYIMKQILQPLVENSIRHGFKDLPRQGRIDIRCYQMKEEVWIDVIDNGWGFPTEKKEEKGYALKNLKERLNIAFDEHFVFEQKDTAKGSWICLKFPLLNEEDFKVISMKSGE